MNSTSSSFYSRLGRFMRDNGIEPRHLLNLRTPPCGQQTLYQLRLGLCDTKRETKLRITRALGRVLGRHVALEELFEGEKTKR